MSSVESIDLSKVLKQWMYWDMGGIRCKWLQVYDHWGINFTHWIVSIWYYINRYLSTAGHSCLSHSYSFSHTDTGQPQFFQHCLKYLQSDRKDVLLSNSAFDYTQQVFRTSKTQRQIARNSPLTPCRFFQHFRTFLMAVQFTIATSSSPRYKVKLSIYLAWVHILQCHWFVLSYCSASWWSNTWLTTTKKASKEKKLTGPNALPFFFIQSRGQLSREDANPKP